MPHTGHQNQDREESLVTKDQVTGLCSISRSLGRCESSQWLSRLPVQATRYLLSLLVFLGG